MGENISKKEEKQLRTERDDLIAQSEEFLEEDMYEILPELFTSIAEISDQLGEKDIADDFRNRAETIQVALSATPLSSSNEPSHAPTSPTPQNPPPTAYPNTPPTPPLNALSTDNSPLDTFLEEPDVIDIPTYEPPRATTPQIPAKENTLTDKLAQLKQLVDYKPSVPSSSTPPAAPSYSPVPPSTPSVPPPIAPAPPPAISIPPPTHSSKSSLIEQRRTEKGAPLKSGIVPTIVKDEWEVILEILKEKVPLMPDDEKAMAVEKILSYPPGSSRDAWLKVFLIKNKKYTRKSF